MRIRSMVGVMIQQETMVQMIYPPIRANQCGNFKCGKMVQSESPCFRDTLGAAYYCDSCGKCLRYHRKKAAERGEDIPIRLE